MGAMILKDDVLTSAEQQLIKVQKNYFDCNDLTEDTEFHGENIFQGGRVFRGQNLQGRINLFKQIAEAAIDAKISFILTRINVARHKSKYRYPHNEYSLAFMLTTERLSAYLDDAQDIGLMIGDEEQSETARIIKEFNEYKTKNKTHYFGRPIQPIKDTVYFSKSHHSRFIQMADVLLYMASRYEREKTSYADSWHNAELSNIWAQTKARIDFRLNSWL